MVQDCGKWIYDSTTLLCHWPVIVFKSFVLVLCTFCVWMCAFELYILGTTWVRINCWTEKLLNWTELLCAVLLITGVSALMLLMMSLLNVNVFRYVLRHVMYCDLGIKIQIASWGILIVTPLYLTLTGPPLVCTQLILSLCSANDRLRYFVTTSPIGWVQA